MKQKKNKMKEEIKGDPIDVIEMDNQEIEEFPKANEQVPEKKIVPKTKTKTKTKTKNNIENIINNSIHFAAIIELQRNIRKRHNKVYRGEIFINHNETINNQQCQKCKGFKAVYLCKSCQNGFQCYKCCQTLHTLGNKKLHKVLNLYDKTISKEQQQHQQKLIIQLKSLIDEDDIAKINQCFAKLDKMKAGFIELDKCKQWIYKVLEQFPENAIRIIEILEVKYLATEIELQKTQELYENTLHYVKFQEFLEIFNENQN